MDARVNDPSLNTLADGTGIATIETGVAYPASNYVPLAGIVAGVISDERTYAKISETGLANSKFKTVRVASTTDVSIASVNNGSIMDGITLVTGDNILLKDQITTAQNGIYTVNNAGGLTRSILAR